MGAAPPSRQESHCGRTGRGVTLLAGTSMGYIQRTLIAGESVLYRAHLHWVVLFGHALIGALGMLLGLGLVAGTFITTGITVGGCVFGHDGHSFRRSA